MLGTIGGTVIVGGVEVAEVEEIVLIFSVQYMQYAPFNSQVVSSGEKIGIQHLILTLRQMPNAQYVASQCSSTNPHTGGVYSSTN
jgi:hypothetical protein